MSQLERVILGSQISNGQSVSSSESTRDKLQRTLPLHELREIISNGVGRVVQVHVEGETKPRNPRTLSQFTVENSGKNNLIQFYFSNSVTRNTDQVFLSQGNGINPIPKSDRVQGRIIDFQVVS